MRKALLALAALAISTGLAFAKDTEGLIKHIDQNAMTITLDDGQTYKLPDETDMSAIKEGMDVVIRYSIQDGVKQITDMVLPE